MHVSNWPLVYGIKIENVRITGGGKIRSNDPYCLDPRYTHYAKDCSERIHVVPVAFYDCKNIEVSDVEIVRANNYHSVYYACENVFIGNVKMHEAKCVSGDGMGLAIGTHQVKIMRVFLESNDDGVVLWSSYKDPRGLLWWKAKPEQDNSIRDITTCHSYINSGGGKAIAIIPWGTDNPNQENQEIYNIIVYDNVLQGGYSVGPWFDNPFNGRQSFDNAEMDDYSSVKEFRIHNNEYRSPCDLICIQATDFITDCGLHSAETLQNADFKLGHCYWTIKGEAGEKDGFAWAKGGRIYEGLWLTPGKYTFTAEGKSNGRFFIENAASGAFSATASFQTTDWAEQKLTLSVNVADTYYIGLDGEDAQMRKVQFEKKK